MILINTKTNKKEDIYKKNGKPHYSKIAELIGVHRNTISNWIERGNDFEDYHSWRLYFNEDCCNLAVV